MLIAKSLFDEAKNVELKAGKTLEQTDAAVARVQALSNKKISKIMQETDNELTILFKQKP